MQDTGPYQEETIGLGGAGPVAGHDDPDGSLSLSTFYDSRTSFYLLKMGY